MNLPPSTEVILLVKIGIGEGVEKKWIFLLTRARGPHTCLLVHTLGKLGKSPDSDSRRVDSGLSVDLADKNVVAPLMTRLFFMPLSCVVGQLQNEVQGGWCENTYT